MNIQKNSQDIAVFDNVWGKITISPEFARIIQLDEVQALKYKKQLGMTSRNPIFSGGYHTRYDHAIGVYHVATKLIKACKERFGGYFKISSQEENAFYLSALLHDLGHRVGSHAFERISKTSHENETYKAISNLAVIIDSTFGEGTCKYVLEILDEKKRVKKENELRESDKIDLLFVLSELMVGSVDIDRIDYISRDYLNIYGEKKDFSVLFNYMELELINNRPKIVFNEQALNILEDYLITRFRLYNDVHFHPYVMIQDEYFKTFILKNYNPNDINIYKTETEINQMISLNNSHSMNGYKMSERIKDILDKGDFSEICYRKFNSSKEANIFFIKLSTIIDNIIEEKVDFCKYIVRKVTVYDKAKNSILLKLNHEIKDITSVSRIIKDKISQNTICIYVDLALLKYYLDVKKSMDCLKISKVIEEVISLFESSDKEIEYKFTVSEDKREDVIDKIIDKYSLSSVYKEQVNHDIYYYIPGIFEPKDGSIRIREVDGKIKPTIKFALEDETSITKRYEYNFSDISKEEFYNVAKKILEEKGYQIQGNIKDSERIKIDTLRKLYTMRFKGSIIELALDKSQYKSLNNDERVNDMMIEIELKEGHTLDLWEFVSDLKETIGKDSLIDCTNSKLSRAVTLLNK